MNSPEKTTASPASESRLFWFRLRGRGQNHAWKRKCSVEAAVLIAMEEADQYAEHEVYHGLVIRVIDETGNEVTRVPVAAIVDPS